jgi:hypothetical protein
MASKKPQPRHQRLEYHAFGESRSADLRSPSTPSGEVVVILAGDAMFGIELERPAARGLVRFGDRLAEALVDDDHAVVRPIGFDAVRDAAGCVDATRNLLEEARRATDGDRCSVVGLSATAPLLAVAAADADVRSFVLVSPPILETYGNRPERMELALAEALGVPAEIAAGLGTMNPMQVGGRVAKRGLVVHGAADTVVPAADAIGWRASLAAAGIGAGRLEVAFAEHDLDPSADVAIDGILAFLGNDDP